STMEKIGSWTGAMLMSFECNITMSARLPGVSVPIRPSRRNALAPLMVAHSRASRERQCRLHLAEHLAGGVELDTDADRGRPALLAERRDHRVADVVMQCDQH